MQAGSSSPSTDRPAPARGRSRARSRRISAIATSTAAPCIARSAGKPFRTGLRSTTKRRVTQLAKPSRIDVERAGGHHRRRRRDAGRSGRRRSIAPPRRSRACRRFAPFSSNGSAPSAPAAASSWKAATSARSCSRDADVKIYLDASPEERARRRASDPAHGGGSTAVAEVATALTARDELDRTRTASPLYAGRGRHADRHDREVDRARSCDGGSLMSCRSRNRTRLPSHFRSL